MPTTFAPYTATHRLSADDWLRNLRRQGTPDRVHFIELFQDWEIEEALDARFQVTAGLNRSAPEFWFRRSVAMQRFLGYPFIPIGLLDLDTGEHLLAKDTADAARADGRSWVNEATGPIMTWEDFEKYRWPDGRSWDLTALEWYEKNLPDDMCLIARQGHFCEYLCWLLGYETLCLALHEQRDLVAAIARKILELEEAATRVLLQSKRVKVLWASDDLGFKNGLLFSPADMRAFVFPGHRRLAELSHAAGHPYLLHACGKRASILEDLLGDVKIDGLHSWEDTIELVTDAKRAYGHRVALLGGIDLDFLCRATEPDLRARVRETLKVCLPGGGYFLGTGNSVANYLPLDHYLAMLDEGRRYSG